MEILSGDCFVSNRVNTNIFIMYDMDGQLFIDENHIRYIKNEVGHYHTGDSLEELLELSGWTFLGNCASSLKN